MQTIDRTTRVFDASSHFFDGDTQSFDGCIQMSNPPTRSVDR